MEQDDRIYREKSSNSFNKGKASSCGTSACVCPKAKIAAGNPNLINHEWCSSKAQINGTVAHITAIFGFTLSGLVVQDVENAIKNKDK